MRFNNLRFIIAILSLGALLWVLLSMLLKLYLKPNSPPRPAAKMEAADSLREFQFTQIHMAMPVRLTVWSSNQNQAKSACRKAFERVAALERCFSKYDPQSELSRLQREGHDHAFATSDDLFLVLDYAIKLSHQTSGAFDPTAGTIVNVWRESRREGRLPPQSKIEQALDCVGYAQVVFNAIDQTITLASSDIQFDLGGIAKGFIGDEVLKTLKANGISIACFEAGGDIVLGDPPPHQRGWDVDLGPTGVEQFSNCGVSISGDEQQFLEIEGKRYSHVVDPRTGMSVTSRQSAIVVAPTGLQSDALATLGTVLSPTEFEAFLAPLSLVRGWTKNVGQRPTAKRNTDHQRD